MQVDFSGTFQHDEEQTFTAKKDISKTFYRFHIVFDGALKSCHITGIDLDTFAGLQIFLDQAAVNFQEDDTPSGQFLHDKTLAAKQTGFKFGHKS